MDHLHMKSIESFSLQKLMQLAPYSFIEIEFNDDYILKNIRFINPERFYSLFKDQFDYPISYDEFYDQFIQKIEQNPEGIFQFIAEKEKFLGHLKKLKEKQELFFSIRFYSNPKKINNHFIAFCNLFLIEPNKTFFIIQDTTVENYFLKLISEAAPIGLFLYRDTFKFVNEELCKITEYSKEELYQMHLWDVAEESIRETIKQIALQRIEGKLLEKHYNEAPVVTKSGKIKWLMVYANTIMYKGNYHGFGICIDITEKKIREEENKKLQRLYYILNNVQDILIKTEDTKEILKKIAEVFIESDQFLLAWVGKEVGDRVLPEIIVAKEEIYKKYLENIQISVDQNSPYGKGPTGIAHRENRIVTNNHSFDNPAMEPWLEKLRNYNFYSTCSIPIKSQEASYSINLYTNIKNYFDEEEVKLLYRVKSTMEYALYKIYQNQWLKIFQKIIENAPVEFLITDEKSRIIYANSFTEQLTGYTWEEMYLQDPKIFSSHLHSKEFYQKLWNHLLNKKSFEEIFINRKKNGELYYLHTTILPILENDRITNFASIGVDITEKILIEEQNKINLFFDPITKLPNRSYFSSEIETYLKLYNQPFALIDIDIFSFHFVNNRFGFRMGDLYLKKFAEILHETLHRLSLKNLICRKGDDEFLIMIFLENLNKQVVLDFLENLKKECKKNHQIKDLYTNQETSLNFSYHAGISFYPEDLEKNLIDSKNFTLIANHMVKNAEMSLFDAKKEEEYAIKFYQPKIEEEIQNFIFIKQNIFDAIQKKEFNMYYQPYFSIENSHIVGAEALVRWQKNGKIISPAEFIPYLEKTGQLIEVEQFIFDLVLEFYQLLQKENFFINISMNVSPLTLNKTNFAQNILQKIQEYNIDPSRLIFEITESSLIENFDHVIHIIRHLNNYKIRFALDDFGSGYSSLAYIEELPVDLLKIDRILIKHLSKDTKKIPILEMIIQLAHKLSLKTVAEGVENETELNILRNLECDYAQGYLLGKPMPKESLLELLIKINNKK
jgi:diguanylate cyclase (GGDEF)-like protein/PAS domain S-box-containing protein